MQETHNQDMPSDMLQSHPHPQLKLLCKLIDSIADL